MKCYAIFDQNEGVYIAAHSLINSVQCYCDYTGLAIHELPQYGLNVSRINVKESRKIKIIDSEANTEELLFALVKQRNVAGVLATFKPLTFNVNEN